MAELRVFSYLPNPRLAKAAIAARLNGVSLEIRGAKPRELVDWLWDFDAHPMDAREREDKTTARVAARGFRGTLHKTDAFLAAHPFGNVPAAFSPDGRTGIFESNSILRAVGRLGQERVALYGDDAYVASRIDAFLDASLVFAIDGQRYLFALSTGQGLDAAYARMRETFESYLGGIEAALATSSHVAADELTLADIGFVCELTLFALERHEGAALAALGAEPLTGPTLAERWPRAHAHFQRLLGSAGFAAELDDYYQTMTLSALFA